MRTRTKIIIAIVIILAIVAGFALAGWLYVKHLYNKMEFKPLDETDLGINIIEKDIKEAQIENCTKFVIFGSDSRDENNQYYGRSDTIIIVNINNDTKEMKFISIPRDTYVDVPGYGMTKINHAFAYGQEQLSIKTINSNFGLDLNQYITIDFNGLIAAIDRIGGVEVNLDADELSFINLRMDAANKIEGGPGKHILNGKQALVHSRNRYVGNDFARAQRQRTIIISALNKVMKQNETEILSIVDDILPYVTTNMDINKYKNMFLEVAKNRTDYLKDIKSVQIPSLDYGEGMMIDGIYYFGYNKDLALKDFKKYYYNIEEKQPEETQTENSTTQE